MEKKSKIVIIIIAVLGVALVVAGGFFVLSNRKKGEDKPKEEEKKELTEEEKGNIINDIMVVGIELYNNQKYLELPKSETSGYYATVGKLKELGYTNANELVMNCKDADAVIFFDVDHPEKYQNGPPIMTMYDCSGYHLNSNS